jgi:hypothetical protein
MRVTTPEKEMTHAIIPSKKGRRHEVDFGDARVRAGRKR